ncbi:delta endotoxin C-terminal domain-containing protein, partial [Bacillus toyonensis]|uniref:delta endotoxin C-terminal domain-containing protein n=1 Tax=Bacillus toyonensis TaxID=155322 RepID=UPI002E1AE605
MSSFSVWTIALTSGQLRKSYRIRIRYASSGNCQLVMRQWGGGDYYTREARHNVTTTYSGPVTYNAFRYLDIFNLTTTDSKFDLTLDVESGGALLIDKIEFIPIEGSLEAFEADQDLEKARKAVNALFTSDAKNALKLNVTDYAIDQAANLVECLSDEFCDQEKMILLDQVKFAKRLSQARNLLNYGDFESPDWSGENGWKTSPHVHVASDNPIFKGRYLHMPGANQPQMSDTVYPTYLYQKVD